MKMGIGMGVMGLLLPAAAMAQDPTALGPFAVATAEYFHGNEDFECPTGDPNCTIEDSEVLAEVYYPDALAGGPFPLVLFLHGFHNVCYNPADGTLGTWLAVGGGCASPYQPIPSYKGYDYIGKVMASHGFIVVSISANGINSHDDKTFGEIGARAYLIEKHLEIWDDFNTIGGSPYADLEPFTTRFIGKVDMNRIGTMGQSRGGDGVATHYALFNGFSPYRVRAVLPVAPTNFGATVTGADLGVLVGYCDGDVEDLDGLLFYDRSRYADPADESTKYTFLSLGSNHNYFNTVWTPECWTGFSCGTFLSGVMPDLTYDDGVGHDVAGEWFCDPGYPTNGRLTAEEQRRVATAYIAGFFRAHLGDEKDLLPFLRGDAAAPSPIDSNELYSAYQPGASLRRDVNHYELDSEKTKTTLKGTFGIRGTVTSSGLDKFERCGKDVYCFALALREAHTYSDVPGYGLSRMKTQWDAPTDSLVNTLPPGTRDVRAFNVLQFRAGIDYWESTDMSPITFSVVLTDGTGASAVVPTTQQLGNDKLYYPPGGTHPITVMSTVRMPLGKFTGINLADVRSVGLFYNGTAVVTLMLSDLAFVKNEQASSCTEAVAIDLGAASNNVTAPADGCVMVRNSYPWYWGSSRTMKLENTSPGNYPVPFTWTNSCSGGSGSGTYTADWQAKYFNGINSACATLIDLQGAPGGHITLRYWAN